MAPKVLLVDDEADITNTLKHTPHKESYDILVAASATEALEVLTRELVHVVVADEKMPGMSGTQLLAKIRQQYPDTVRRIYR